MFKVMLVVYAMNGAIISQVGYESVSSCMKDREMILSQTVNVNAICMPSNSEYTHLQIDRVFDKFKSMVRELKNDN